MADEGGKRRGNTRANGREKSSPPTDQRFVLCPTGWYWKYETQDAIRLDIQERASELFQHQSTLPRKNSNITVYIGFGPRVDYDLLSGWNSIDCHDTTEPSKPDILVSVSLVTVGGWAVPVARVVMVVVA